MIGRFMNGDSALTICGVSVGGREWSNRGKVHE